MTTPHDKALAAFTDYFVRNYPGPDTVIFDPKWHAPKLFNAAMKAIEASGGVVCAREPVGNIHINSLELLKEGSIAHIYPIATVNDRMRPLHIPMAAADATAPSPAEQFSKWLEDGPRLAKAAGCYVGIKVTNLPSPPSPSNEGEKP